MDSIAEILAPENMSIRVKCEVCRSVVPKGETFYYKRKQLRYCSNCKDINLEEKLKLAGRN